MKKTLGIMALGAGMGAGMMYMYEQYQNGNMAKTMNKGAKAVSNVAKKMNK